MSGAAVRILTRLIEGAGERRSKRPCSGARKVDAYGQAPGEAREAVRLRTCQFFLPLHPSDGRSRLAADGRAGELRLIALADHLVAALDEGASWGD